MAVKATVSTRAPRGTKTLTQAFFSAAESIPDAQRLAVVKAALAAIRDQIKNDREKSRAATAKARARASTARARKPAAPKLATPEPVARKTRGKAAPKDAAPDGM
jgi:hypothetical protein